MLYYGLHFTSDDRVPVQVRVDTSTQAVWARTAPRGGAWTEWRRLDVMRNPDGSLNERIAEAVHAQRADTAGRFAKAMKLRVTGDATGTVSFDGSGDVTLSLNIAALAAIHSRLDALEAHQSGGGNNGNDDYGNDGLG